jgi:uncharacterized protein YbjT (DUF2867 family)
MFGTRRKIILTGVLACLTLNLPVPVVAESGGGVFVFGGTRGVGLEIVRQLDAKGVAVTVLVRASSDLTGLKETGAQRVTGDALDPASLEKALASGRFGVAVSTLSGNPDAGYEADGAGNINAVNAAGDAGIERFLLISSIGVGDSEKALPPPVIEALGAVLKEKARAEKALIESGMTYTILRPGGLTNKPSSGKGYLTEDPMATGIISRAELARLTVGSIDDEETFDKILSALE